MAEKHKHHVHLWNRKGHSRTRTYPEIVIEMQQLAVDDLCIDGEMISFGTTGIPEFHRVLKRDLANQPNAQIAVAYVVFDCLRVNGTWLVDTPIEARLEKLFMLIPSTGAIQTSPLYEDGELLYERMKGLHMEGVVGKCRNSHYVQGRSDLWKKFKCWKTLNCIVLSVKLRNGHPVSLIVADAEDATRTPLGSVATGLSAKDWKIVMDRLPAGPQTKDDAVMTLEAARIYVQVRYLDMTDDGRLRTPVVQSIEFL